MYLKGRVVCTADPRLTGNRCLKEVPMRGALTLIPGTRGKKAPSEMNCGPAGTKGNREKERTKHHRNCANGDMNSLPPPKWPPLKYVLVFWTVGRRQVEIIFHPKTLPPGGEVKVREILMISSKKGFGRVKKRERSCCWRPGGGCVPGV